jgi:hypothetical protein
MKKLLLMLFVGSIFSLVAFAQDNQKESQDWDEYVKEQLKLTPDQTVKYDAVVKEYKAKMDAIVADGSMTPEVKKEKLTALKKEKETKIMAFLTPEQQALYKDLIEKNKKDSLSMLGS